VSKFLDSPEVSDVGWDEIVALRQDAYRLAARAGCLVARFDTDEQG
jgi:hypothetical protein